MGFPLTSSAVILVLLSSALGAYSIGGIPVSWMGNLLAIGTVSIILGRRGIHWHVGMTWIAMLLCWASVVTVVSISLHDFSALMPRLATTSYLGYVSLRFIEVSAYIAQLLLAMAFIAQRGKGALIRIITNAGIAVAVVAIYIYFAQAYGLPEPPRTRVGTNGEVQLTTFQFAFHRAMGTFREPSHLAEWLLLPLLLSFATRTLRGRIGSGVIGSAMLLTGSMTGIVSAALGLGAALMLSNPFSLRGLQRLAPIALIVVCCMFAFRFLAFAGPEPLQGIEEVLWNRLAPIVERGAGASNRGYVYEYVERTPVGLTGSGLGNANLLFTRSIGNNAVSSFLSLYINVIYSTGIIGLILLIGHLIAPLKEVGRKLSSADGFSRTRFFIIASYVGWLVVFAVHSEEFHLMFALVYALMGADSRRVLIPVARRAFRWHSPVPTPAVPRIQARSPQSPDPLTDPLRCEGQ